MFLSNLFSSFRRTVGKPARRPQRRAFRPRLEQLEGRLVPAGFIWQNAWDVSLWSDSGDGGDSAAAFGNIGAAGDEGPASAAASALAQAWGINGTADDSPQYATFTGSVSFRRTFQLAGSPTGWNVSLDGLLSGSLTASASGYDAWADVTARVHIIQGTPDAAGIVTHDLDFGHYQSYSASGSRTLSVSVPGTRHGVISNGTYTVIGSLVASATGHGVAIGPGTDTGGQAYSRFYTPPGLVTTIDAVPWNNQPAVSISDATFVEGNTGAVARYFTVALSNPSGQPVTVNYATADGSAISANDYTAASGTLTFAPGETSKTISVLVNGDRLAEPNETFFVNLNSPTNATIADGQGLGTIVDDEPRISISDVTKKEGNSGTTLFVFTVSLSATYDALVMVNYATADGNAKVSDNDYLANSGTLTFAPGETMKTITIEVKGDSKKEAKETFYLDLFGNSSNSLFAKNRGLGTILNDD
jgi:hypothetical protein